MICVFGHYVSPALRGLLGAEALLVFGSFGLGPVLWQAWGERGADPDWAATLPSVLAGTLALGAILIALRLYERRFWRGRADILLRVGLAIGLECRFREPILYRQVRVGQRERPFTILKFRTVRANAGSEFAKPGDPRITRVGRLLRETRIDELPQWFNVLRGEMVRGPIARGDSVLRSAPPGSARSHRLGADLLPLRRFRGEFAGEAAIRPPVLPEERQPRLRSADPAANGPRRPVGQRGSGAR